MGYLRGFVPWIVNGVVASFDLRWGCLAGLLTGVLLLAAERRRGVAMDALVLESSSVAYFVVMGCLALAFDGSSLHTYADAASFLWLALTAWLSIAVRQPFTLGIARRQTPRELWNLPAFIKVNVVIAAVWGAGFSFICAALAICHYTDAPAWMAIAAHVVGLVGPMIFTSRYPARVQARAQAAMAETPA